MSRRGLLFESTDGLVRFLVEPGPPVLCGRAPPLEPRNVWLPSPFATRRHFQISGDAHGFVLEDVGSSGGTYLDDALVRGPTPIGPGAVITLNPALRFTARAFSGETLWELIERGPLPRPAARSMLVDVTRHLAVLHAAGRALVHYTPRAIVRDDDGRCALLVTNWPTVDTNGEPMLGNPIYVAPDRDLGAPADLYTLGLIYYEALAACRPFDGDTPLHVLQAKRHGVMPPFDPSWDEGLRDLLRLLLNADAARRPTAAAFLDRLVKPHLD